MIASAMMILYFDEYKFQRQNEKLVNWNWQLTGAIDRIHLSNKHVAAGHHYDSQMNADAQLPRPRPRPTITCS
ncbi:unnamed protein product [Lactuca virosa]|uniref:Uncharacterized protein n=1 Tax=Lactuca virosa TaxID=75947 RepID=A0AAU9LXH2_9ASTR|nr:unnamed protein product [Lactuca virosa]